MQLIIIYESIYFRFTVQQQHKKRIEMKISADCGRWKNLAFDCIQISSEKLWNKKKIESNRY